METLIVPRICPNCRKESTIELDAEKYRRWVAGEHVQNVWPELSMGEREQIMTGFCPNTNCWEEYLGPEPD
jgi:hypothetical protein